MLQLLSRDRKRRSIHPVFNLVVISFGKFSLLYSWRNEMRSRRPKNIEPNFFTQRQRVCFVLSIGLVYARNRWTVQRNFQVSHFLQLPITVALVS